MNDESLSDDSLSGGAHRDDETEGPEGSAGTGMSDCTRMIDSGEDLGRFESDGSQLYIARAKVMPRANLGAEACLVNGARCRPLPLFGLEIASARG